MLNIKSFVDGDRLIVAIDGLEKNKRESIVENFLTSLTSSVTICPPSMAKPLEAEQEPTPAVDTFQSGIYKGMTPEVALSTAEKPETVLANFTALMEEDIDESLRSAIYRAGRGYLIKRFVKCDADTYKDKLNESQLQTFYVRYSPFFSRECKRALCALTKKLNYYSFLSCPSGMREGITIAIQDFQKI